MVDALGEAGLADTGLQAAVQELLNGETKDVVELVLGLGEQTEAHEAAQQSLTFEQTLGVLLRHGQQSTGHGTDLGQSVLGAPDLALAAQTVLTEELHLAVQTLLLKRTARDLGDLTIVMVIFTHCPQISI